MAGRIAYLGNIVTQGLILDLDAAKKESYPGTGSTWSDISGNGLTGTLTNGPTFSSSDYGSLVFDGVDDYAATPNIMGGFTDYSAEFWFKMTTNTSGVEKWLGSQYPGGGIVGRLIFDIYTDNKLRNFISGTSVNGSTTILTNTWYHAVFTRNNTGSATIYLNGILDGSGTIATVAVASTAFQIGGSTVLTRWLNGTISTVKLYNRALSASEIQQNFNAYRSRYGI